MRNFCVLAAFTMAVAAPLCASSVSAPAPDLLGSRVIERLDAVRPSPRFPKGRPIQIAFSYSSASVSRQLTYRDYYSPGVAPLPHGRGPRQALSG